MRNINAYTNDEKREAINQVISSKRDRYILLQRMVDGVLIKEIAYDPSVYLSERQVYRILKRHKPKLLVYMRRKRIKRFFE